MKTYLIRDYELRKFKAEYSTLTSNNTYEIGFFVKAWISEISPDGKKLKLIVSEEKPQILFSKPAQIPIEPRTEMSDEKEAESRKDTVWGDLKLLAKKTIREGKHQLDHYQKVKTESVVAPINLTIQFSNLELSQPLKEGEAYYFRLLAAPVGLFGRSTIAGPILSLFDSFPMVITSDFVSPDVPANISGSFADFIRARSRTKWIIWTVASCLIIPGCIHMFNQAGDERKAQEEHEAFVLKQRTVADKRYDELNKKAEAATERLKETLETRRDIGLLAEGTGIGWVGRGSPVTIHQDGSWNEEKMQLMLFVQEKWQTVPYRDQIEGLKTICKLWRGIWGVGPNGEAEIIVARNMESGDRKPIGGCKRSGDEWLTKEATELADAEPSGHHSYRGHGRRRH